MTWFLLTSFCRPIKIIINSETKINSTKSSCSEVFLVKDVLKICSKFTGEHPCRSVILIKLQSNFFEITLRHGYSPVNLLQISIHLFLRTPLGGCFCSTKHMFCTRFPTRCLSETAYDLLQFHYPKKCPYSELYWFAYFFTKENILVNTVYFDNHISQMLFSHILSFNWKCRILLESDNSDMIQFLFLFLSSIVLPQTERFSTEDWTTWEI